MCKYILFLLFLSLPLQMYAQEKSNYFTIEGDITNSFKVDWEALGKYKTTFIDSLPIYNHLMEPKGTLRHIKGVLLKDILGNITLNEKSPKLWSQYYIVCAASDGYKVVFSWNEIFNSETGNKAMVIIEKDGTSAKGQKDSIALVTPTDKATGRRYVKALSQLIIRKIN